MKKLIKYISFTTLFLFVMLVTNAYYYEWHMWYWSWMMWYWYGFWYIYTIIFILVIIALFAFLFKWLHWDYRMQWHKKDYIEILKNRLASGEIKEDEYDKLKKKLGEK